MNLLSPLGFDRPVISDPLFRIGLVFGPLLSVIGSILYADSFWEGVLNVVFGTLFVIGFVCGTVLAIARALCRRHQVRRTQ